MSDDDDFVSILPLQRSWSQISHPQPCKEEPSQLSLSQGNRRYGVSLSKRRKLSRLQKTPKYKGPAKSFSCSTPIIQRKNCVENFYEGGLHRTFEQKLNNEVCPICMMPWSSYECHGKSRDYHVDKCLDVDFSVLSECEAGLECHEVHENHFWNFTHKVLAELREKHKCPVPLSLSKNVKDQEDRKDLITVSKIDSINCDIKYENLAVAGPSQVGESTVITKRERIDSCNFSSKIKIEQDRVSSDEDSACSKTNESVQLFDLDDSNNETLTFTSGQKSLLGEHYPALDRLKKFGNIKQTCRELNIDNLEDPEVLDLDISSVSQIKHDTLKNYEYPVGHGETVGSQIKRSDISMNDSFSENTVIFRRSCADQNFMADFTVTETSAPDPYECSENARNVFDGLTQKSSSPSVSLLQDVTGSVRDKEIKEKQRQNKTLIEDDDRTTHMESYENDNDGNESSFDKSMWFREKCQKNIVDGLGDLVELAVEKYFDVAEKKVQRNERETSPQKEEDTKTSEKLCYRGPTCKPCIHIHFHLEKLPEPSRRGSQTSILDFFHPTKADRLQNSSTSKKCSACCSCGGGESKPKNDKSRAESWKELMSMMQKKNYNLPSAATSSVSLVNSKDDTSCVKEQNQHKKNSWQQRRCPFYKYIPDTDIVVDAFCYGYLEGVRAYFLTHFHYDHYRGLKKNFNRPIYCSEITAKLVNLRIGVLNQYLHPLPIEESQVVCDVEVTLLDANHCPGSVMFLFKLRTGSTVLHVGDFRAHSKMESCPALWNSSIDALYLDTTYCNPLYDFPSQEDVLEKCVSVATSHVLDNPKTLIVVGSYSIGKERVFKAIASSMNCRIWASHDKQRILRCIQDEEIQARLTSDKHSARVHVLPMADLKPQKLMKYVETLKPRYTVIVAIRPTGWEHSGDGDDILDNLSPKEYGNIYIYGIPYSEHSSYAELKRFVRFVQPKKVIPTVNVGNPSTRKRMEQDIKEWLKK